MATQRTAFAKRQREQNRKDKARAKQARMAARRAQPGSATKGPPIGEPPAPIPTDDIVIPGDPPPEGDEETSDAPEPPAYSADSD